jgi:AraC-like DNA-binding protein
MTSIPREAGFVDLEGAFPARRYEYDLSADSPVAATERTFTAPTATEVDVHEGLEVGVTLSGAQERHWGEWVETVGVGDVWLAGMWEPHGWRILTPGTHNVVLTFLPVFLGDELLGDDPWLTLFAVPPQARPRVSSAEMRRQTLAVGWEIYYEIHRQPYGWQTALRLDLLRILLVLRRAWTPPTTFSPATSPVNDLGRVMPALRLLHDDPQGLTTVAQAAAACSLGSSQFASIFRRTMGVTFGRFRTRAKLSGAAQLLLASSHSIEAIAHRTGFASGTHLHDAFLRHYGCTPGQYRQRHRSA